MLKPFFLILIFYWTNISVGQSIEINNGIDSIYLGAENKIKIKTDLPNVILQCESGELRKVEDRYYIFMICDSTITEIKFFLKSSQNKTLIKDFQFRVFIANDPVIVPIFRGPPKWGVRAISTSRADLAFGVKEFKLEIVRRDGGREVYLNHGCFLNWESYNALKVMKCGDTFRILDLIAFNNCEEHSRRLPPSKIYTIQ